MGISRESGSRCYSIATSDAPANFLKANVHPVVDVGAIVVEFLVAVALMTPPAPAPKRRIGFVHGRVSLQCR
jgi:hypothetical protein